jgi:hypothetical protein
MNSPESMRKICEKDIENNWTIVHADPSQVLSLLDRLESAETALRFYGDSKNYNKRIFGFNKMCQSKEPIYFDSGKNSREHFEKFKE